VSLPYPPAPHGDDVERIAGLTFPDPYRPLEDGADEAVAAWQAAQTALADGYVAALPGLDRLRGLVAHHLVARVGLPVHAGGRWFRAEHAPGATQAHVVVADGPFADGRTVADAADHVDGEGRTPFLSWLSPSPDGRLLAVGLCHDGSEANTIRLVDVESGTVLDDRPSQLLMDSWMGGAQWLADSSGFFYVALDGPKDDFLLRVYRHDVGRPARTAPEDVPLVEGAGQDYVGVFVSRDGRYAVASQNLMQPRPVAVLDLHDEAAGWRPFVDRLDATVAGHVVGDELVAVTDVDAPRGRLVAIPLASATPNDPSTWRTLVPASDAVIRSATPIGDVLYVAEFVDTYARLRIVGRDGAPLGEVPLPGRGAIAEPPFPLMALKPPNHPDELVFSFSSLVESWGVYRHRPGVAALETLQQPEVRLDATVEDRWATSPDGTRVPYHVVRPAGATPAGPRPALIYAYGGFNVPRVPDYPRAMAAFVEAGGLFVLAHIRGGAEFGLEWWEGGRLARKQNCYADLYAVAEDLVAAGLSAVDRLAVTGGSNGGLMSGVAVTQRPDLWRAVVPRVPLLDVLGACREPYGRAAVAEEFGDPDDPDDVARLATFSPYHLVRDGTAYPAVYLDVGATDPRCPPWHGRKLAARLQEASAGDEPILLRIWENVGHGWATARDTEIAQNTAWLAFVLDRVGLLPLTA
jgi:prolyl oligopeptidase